MAPLPSLATVHRTQPAHAGPSNAREAQGATRQATPHAVGLGTTGLCDVTALANADGAARISAMREINETAGNRAAATVAVAAGRHVQRDDGAAPAAPKATSYALTNARFAGQKRLQEIANGGAALSKSDPAAAVKPVQTALLDLGYSLLRYKDDGKFGDETTQAIDQFRTDRGVVMGDGMDANALRRLDALAPAPGKQEEHYLDYSRLFADGKLDVTLAIGYDEGQTHFADLTSARDWMARMKLVKTTSPADQKAPPPPPPGVDVITGASPIAPDANAATRQGLSVPEVYTGKRTVTYPDKSGTRVTKEIAITITLVPPGTGGKAAFQKGLQESELMYYSGHARRGIGPDFDKDKSPYENFIIGVGSALHAQGRVQAATAVAQSHYVIDKKNDLEAMKDKWDAEKYRVWFFNACSSIAYFDELRGGLLPEKMDRHNLDLFGTNQEVPIAAGLSPIFANLEGMLNGETMEQIVANMQAASIAALRKILVDHGITDEKVQAQKLKEFQSTMFVREGAGDNPVAAKP